jgi:hypothetical protein
MIRIFRLIRQRLLTQGKLSKYILYAIGEIALVMIGILLALQVNSWNQQRLNEQKEKELILNLRGDVAADIFMLNENLKVVDSKERFLVSILAGNLEGIEYIKEDLTGGELSLFMSRMQAPPNVRDNTYREMITTGTLTLLQNDTLKEKMHDYYRFVDNRKFALRATFSDWPRVLSENIPADGGIHADSPSIRHSPKELEEIVTSLIAQKESLRPTINAEVQYTDKMRVSFKLQIQRAESLLQIINKEQKETIE